MEGLCGNYNAADDFFMADNGHEFGNKYDNPSCPQLQVDDVPDPCEVRTIFMVNS